MKKLIVFFLVSFSLTGWSQEINGSSVAVYYSLGKEIGIKAEAVVSSTSIIAESPEIEVSIGDKHEVILEKTTENFVDTLVLQKYQNVEKEVNEIKKTETILLPSTVFTSVKPINEQSKVALIIGNADYTKSAKLKNPLNDANAIDSALSNIGFKVVKVLNADFNGMRKGLSDFSKLAKNADVALFYYAGHGLQVDGENYLVPINANIETKEQVALETISIEMVIKTLEMTSNQKRLNVLVLDACRSNPFETWSRSTGGGLAQVNPPNGTLIAFATSPGSTAADGIDGNGLYTGELIKQLGNHQRIEDVFINTRVAVEEKSHGQQSPWELARLRGQFYLK
jgi:hypothetical protein